MRSPAESFRLTDAASKWKQIVNQVPEVQTACEYAMLQMLSEMPPNIASHSLPVDPYIGLDVNAKMQGATRVLEILLTICDPVKTTTTTPKATLHYEHSNTRRTAAASSDSTTAAK